MATAAYVPWFDAVKSFSLDAMSDMFSTTPAVTMFLTTVSLSGSQDLEEVFGSLNACRVNALQWCLWNRSEDEGKRQAVISWLIQVIPE
jgi:hypothetical protein